MSLSWMIESCRVELGREEWLDLVLNAFVSAIVHVHEIWFPICAERSGINCETMILRRHEAMIGAHFTHWLVLTTVAIFQLIDLSTCRFSTIASAGRELI